MKNNGKKKKRFSSTFFIVIVLIAGLSLLLYPTISDYWNSYHSSLAIADYSRIMSEIDDSEYDRLLTDARQFNYELVSRKNTFFLPEEKKAEYNELLNVLGTGMMGYIDIPSIDVEIPVFHGTSDATLQTSVGHLEWSSLPVGGENSHCVLSGHRGLPSARLFTDIDKLTVGDTFMLNILNEVFTYEVDSILITLPHETDALRIIEDGDYCTLVTCTPYGINSHRLLVRGHRIENTEEVKEARIVADAMQIEPMIVAPIVAIPMLLVLLLILIFKPVKKKTSVKLSEEKIINKDNE